MACIHKGILLSLKINQEILPICNTVYEPGGHDVKWNKSGTERRVPYDQSHWYVESTKVKFIKVG